MALALAIVCGVAGVHAESSDVDSMAESSEVDGMSEADTLFDKPLDLSTPLPWPASRKPDPSKFTAAAPPVVPWTGKAGIDNRTLASGDFRPERWVPGAPMDQTIGVAWANVTAPGLMTWDKTAIETRVGPYQQGKFGVILSRSVPVGSALSVTVQNGVSLVQPLPQTGVPAWSSHNVENNHAVRFTFLPAATTLSIGAAVSSTDDRWRRSLGAEQKLFGGPFSVTGAVSETGTGDLSKSLKAGFKRSW